MVSVSECHQLRHNTSIINVHPVPVPVLCRKIQQNSAKHSSKSLFSPSQHLQVYEPTVINSLNLTIASMLSSQPSVVNASISEGVIDTSNSISIDNFLPPDIRKVGFMKKLKTNGRKFFVLRLNNSVQYSEATLSYYDNEKKFRTNTDPNSSLCKGKILLRECFAIQKKNDYKQRHVIAIYTPIEMLGCICDDKNELNAWLSAIYDILNCCPEFLHRHFYNFEHIWQVNVQRCSLVKAKIISGLYRVCLVENNLYIIKVDGNVHSQEVFECPLQGIRRCGHSLSTFFLELGRSSLIGPGELWLTTEDPTSAQNMHEIILNAMSTGLEQSDEDIQRFNASNSVSSLNRNHRPRSSSASVHSHQSSISAIGDVHSYSKLRNSNTSDIERSSTLNNSTILIRPNSSSSSSNTSGTDSTAITIASGKDSGCSERSRNTSECSNDEFVLACDCLINVVHCKKGCCSTSVYNSNNSVDDSVSLSLMDFHESSQQIHSHPAHHLSIHKNSHYHHSGEHLTLEPAISEEVDGCILEDCLNTSLTKLNQNDTHSQSSSPELSPSSSTSGLSTPHQSLKFQNNYHLKQLDNHQDGKIHKSNFSTTYELSKLMHGPVKPPKSDSQQSLKSVNSDSKYMHGPARPPLEIDGQQSLHSSLSSVNNNSSTQNQSISVHLSHLRSSRSSSLSGSDRSSCGFVYCCLHHHSQTSPILSSKCSCLSCQQGIFQTLPTVPAGTDDDYLPMAPLNTENSSENTFNIMTSRVGGSVSTTKSESRNQNEDEDTSYMIMAPLAQYDNDGACKNDSFFDGLTRAYSTGSKPKPLAPSIAAQCSVSTQTEYAENEIEIVNGQKNCSTFSRIRALSTGSHTLGLGAFRLLVHNRTKPKSLSESSSCTKNLNQSDISVETDMTTISSSVSSASLLANEVENVISCKNRKSSSAPILSAYKNQRVRSATIGARPIHFTPGTNQQHYHCHCPRCHHHLHYSKLHSNSCTPGFLSTSHVHLNGNGFMTTTGCNHYFPVGASQRRLSSHRHLTCCLPESESDLMEITYKQKPKRGSCGEIIGSFEEESRRNRSRKSSTSGENNSADSASTVENSISTSTKKQSDSNSTLLTSTEAMNGQNSIGNSLLKSSGKSSQIGSFKKLDNLLQPFRSISLHQKSGNLKNIANIKSANENEIMSPLHQIITKPVKMNSMLKKISKEASRETLARQKSAEEREKRLAVQAAVHSSVIKTSQQTSEDNISPISSVSPPPAVSGSSAAKTDLESLTRKLEEKARQMDEENRKYCSSDEESPYVLVVPSDQLLQNASSNNGSTSSSSIKPARKRSSVVRSIISSLGSKESDHPDNKKETIGTLSGNGNLNLLSSEDSQKKKSSTSFSAKLRIGRPNSGGKKNSVLESEGTSISPVSSPTHTKT